MAANSGGSDSTGRKYYYGIVYGMLATNAKEAPEGYKEVELSEIKSKRAKKEKFDLRNTYYDNDNGKDYPLRVFYTDIDGFIESVQKVKTPRGYSLEVTLHDSDGDESILTTDFYGKVATDFLNRLINVDYNNQLNFRPYSVLSEFAAEDGQIIKFYNTGVTIKDGDNKIGRFFTKDNNNLDQLPKAERIQNAQGEEETSRVKQINFLWSKVEPKFAELNANSGNVAAKEQPATPAPEPQAEEQGQPVATAPATPVAQPATAGATVDNDDLPF